MTNPTPEQIQDIVEMIEYTLQDPDMDFVPPISNRDGTIILHVLKQALDPWCYDMSKAPRDGTELLVKDSCHVRMVHYELNASFGNYEYDNGWQEFNCGDDDFYSTAYRTEELSAWMLIPK